MAKKKMEHAKQISINKKRFTRIQTIIENVREES
jgi:hypothetical protein